MAKIALILGSVRSPRVGNDVTGWVHDVLKSRPSDDLQIEPLVIADFNLPVYDEPVMPAMVPAMKQFTKEHSKRWSAAIASYQGYIFVIPEYNGGIAGGTKNAVDYLYNEWPGKPVAIISYGTQGGNRANAQLSESLELVMKMKVAPTKVLLPFAAGTDVFSAINDGVLGEESQKAWAEAGKKEDILKALDEVKELLKQPKE
uniref:NAD(P)H-dependent FMN reductase ntnL n=1 Tax=Nectria sp. TaxID=1755444 RepID=NTNL_NECSZ|nr:RecName: Full=NAD(P)H-dependent FMN reductase ntnL; Short=FMN reductase ntnL; AltName: Full=Nectripenoid biosynthesis cluster protein L [Nectria sp. (in: ascomycete fungi)]AYO60872.1 NADPH-dependent FMN reductase NtnL [Nectria sp. (in: ascomycete fungi)]